jgi:hypothetical protein
MPAEPCRFRRAAQLRTARSERTRTVYASAIRELERRGLSGLLVGVVREAELSRILATLIDRNDADAALLAIVHRIEAFARWCRREHQLVRAQLAAEKEKAPTRGR